MILSCSTSLFVIELHIPVVAQCDQQSNDSDGEEGGGSKFIYQAYISLHRNCKSYCRSYSWIFYCSGNNSSDYVSGNIRNSLKKPSRLIMMVMIKTYIQLPELPVGH